VDLKSGVHRLCGVAAAPTTNSLLRTTGKITLGDKGSIYSGSFHREGNEIGHWLTRLVLVLVLALLLLRMLLMGEWSKCCCAFKFHGSIVCFRSLSLLLMSRWREITSNPNFNMDIEVSCEKSPHIFTRYHLVSLLSSLDQSKGPYILVVVTSGRPEQNTCIFCYCKSFDAVYLFLTCGRKQLYPFILLNNI